MQQPPSATHPRTPRPLTRAARQSAGTRDVAFVVALVAIAAVYLFNLLWHLGDANIGDWDEGRHATTAFEMWRSGDLLVNTYRGAVDYWNLKPPLSFWPIMASFQLFGVSLVSLRIPSVIAGVATGVILVVFAHRRFGRRGAVTTGAVYATCYPLIGSHSARSADPDALFVLFFTIGVLSVLLAPERPRFLLLWTTAFSAAFLTKSWHAGLLLALGVVFLALRGRATAARPRDYAIALLGLLPILAWAIARASFDGTRFFTTMVTYDLLSRSSSALEGNGAGPLYYVPRLVYFLPWLLLLLIPVVGGVGARRALRLRDAAGRWRTADWLGPLVFAAGTFALFSIASTKLSWYIYPAIPPIALLIGIAAAALTRQTGRRVTGAFVGAVLLASLAAEAYVLDKIPGPTAPAQLVLQRLGQRAALEDIPVYLDGALSLDTRDQAERRFAKIGEWPQSLRSAALIDAEITPEEGGVAAFLAADGRRLMLVERGSAAAQRLAGAPVEVLATDGAYRVVELTG